MDLSYTDEERAFQDEVRAFLDEKLPKAISEKVRLGSGLTKEDLEQWHAILNDRGWLAQNWPKEFGGAEWDAVQRHIFEEEAALANAPRIVPFGLAMLAPVLQKFGSKEQCDRWLPRILDGSDWWCQGYSEPGAGSDLASLKTRAVREGDHYIVNGQKTWTTLGQHANMIFCLVRTNTEVKNQEGISFLLIDMDTRFGLQTSKSLLRTLLGKRIKAGPTPSICSPMSVPISQVLVALTQGLKRSNVWRRRKCQAANP